MRKIPCKYGHDISLYNRADGRCGRCHSIREARYRLTLKGRAVTLEAEARRNERPERIYYKFKNAIIHRITSKRKRIAQLEKLI